MRLGARAANGGPLEPDAELIRALAALLAETGLTEIEYAVGERRIRVARNPAANGSAAPAAHAQPMPAAPAFEKAAAPDDPASHPGAVRAPMVGVAYLAPQPGAPQFVQEGDAVTAGQPVLIIEAMKVMNQIRAPRAGRIARILVRDAEPVEYGTVLMVVE